MKSTARFPRALKFSIDFHSLIDDNKFQNSKVLELLQMSTFKPLSARVSIDVESSIEAIAAKLGSTKSAVAGVLIERALAALPRRYQVKLPAVPARAPTTIGRPPVAHPDLKKLK